MHLGRRANGANAEFPVKPDGSRKLQRWVDAGHDTWCRNAEFVAAATLRRIAADTEGEYELVSSTLQKERETRVGAFTPITRWMGE